MPATTNPFDGFKPLDPKPTMGRNELCWCLSGKKWKNCHRLREDEAALPQSAFYARFYEEAKSTRICFHPKSPTDCSSTFSSSHTIQKRTGLLQISENHHVLSARNRSPHDRANLLNRVGINIASTFYGFCSKHDNHTFTAAEKVNDPNEDVAFLLSYRALCFEIYMKQIAVQTLKFSRLHLDRGVEFYEQVAIQQHLAAALFSNSLGHDEHMRHKKDWDTALLSGDRSQFEWAFLQFDGQLPIATSGVFFPEYDFEGKPLQALDAPVGSLALLGFNVLPIGGKTCAIFGWMDKKLQNKRFIDTLHALPDSDLASALIQFGFDTSDNLFVRESWWTSLDSLRKSYLQQNLEGSIPGSKWNFGLVPKRPLLLELPIVARR